MWAAAGGQCGEMTKERATCTHLCLQLLQFSSVTLVSTLPFRFQFLAFWGISWLWLFIHALELLTSISHYTPRFLPCSLPFRLCLLCTLSRFAATDSGWYFAALNISAMLMMKKWSQAVFHVPVKSRKISWLAASPPNGKLKRLAICLAIPPRALELSQVWSS